MMIGTEAGVHCTLDGVLATNESIPHETTSPTAEIN
jgi:hypothetical protein